MEAQYQKEERPQYVGTSPRPTAAPLTGLAALAAATGVAQPSLADLITYQETAPNSGIFNMTLTNTNTVDNLVNLTLDYSAISPTYVDEFIQGNPVFLSGASDATWEYVAGSSGGGVLVFQAENQLSFNYLTPGQQVAFQITHNPDYTGFAQAQAQAGTEASGNLFQNFDAPTYDTVPEASTLGFLLFGLAAMKAARKLFHR